MRAIVASDVWKAYPRWMPGTRSVRSMLTRRMRSQRRSSEIRWALRDISFTLDRGDALGIIGHNGAGKSTLLRLASGLGRPTKGSLIAIPGSAAMLSLGDTFDPELSGAENAITAAIVAGLEPSHARAVLPEVLSFAELEGFEEAPVRSYSEGMKLRLAFGVLTTLSPDLLILDEVLAVGDLRFQQKCMAHIHKLRAGGTSLLLASHDLAEVTELCSTALWIDHGRIRSGGKADAVVENYQEAMYSSTLDVTPAPSDGASSDENLVLRETRFGSQEVTIEDVALTSGGQPGEVAPGESLDIGMTLSGNDGGNPLIVSAAITRVRDEVACLEVSTELDEVPVGPLGSGPVRVILSLDDLELRPGDYTVDLGVYPGDWAHAYDYHWHVYPLTVRGAPDDNVVVYRPQRRRWTVKEV
jgi:homopolymeric O-antigen transport system ATP-binding protein